MAYQLDLQNVKNYPVKLENYKTVPIRINNTYSYLPHNPNNTMGQPSLLSRQGDSFVTNNKQSLTELQTGQMEGNKYLHIHVDDRMVSSTYDMAYNTLSERERRTNLPKNTKTLTENYLYPYNKPHKMLKNQTLN
jgi:hypothetical protein